MQHLFSLGGVLRQNVNGANPLLLMAQRLLDHVPVETLLSQERRAGTSEIVNGEWVHVEGKSLQRLVERIRRKGLS